MSVTYSECVSVALIIQHARRMRRVTLSSVISWLYRMFPHYLINGTIFGRKLLNIKCVFFSFFLQLLSEIFVILRRIQRGTVMSVRRASEKYPLFLSDFNKRLKFFFSTDL